MFGNGSAHIGIEWRFDMRVVWRPSPCSWTGVFEEPGNWFGAFFNEEARQFNWVELQASEAMLLGRKTDEGFAAVWPAMTDDVGCRQDELHAQVRGLSTLEQAAWPGSQSDQRRRGPAGAQAQNDARSR